MSAMNVVRMRVKPGHERAFLDLHETRDLSEFEGMRSLRVVATGDGEYVIVGDWESMEALAAARPAMIATLDQMRSYLEDLGGDLGVTDPRSGEVVVERAGS